jgi:autotransporter-associated beta strand protein
VQSNAVAKITGTSGNQIIHNGYIQTRLNAGGVLDLNSQSQTLDMLSMTNGVLRNGASSTTSTLTIVGTVGVHPTNAVTLTGVSNVFDVPAVDATLNIASIVNGSGSLIKTGLGTVTLMNSNNYTGNVTVSAGTLSTTFPDFANTTTVTIATNAVLNLNFANSETNAVTALIVDGVSKPNGVYNATTDPLYITGTGSLLVTPPINPLAGTIQFGVSANTLTLSWPTNLGWLLQAQTNSVSVGLRTNWVTIPDSAGVTITNFPINPANGAVFYRLAHP